MIKNIERKLGLVKRSFKGLWLYHLPIGNRNPAKDLQNRGRNQLSKDGASDHPSDGGRYEMGRTDQKWK